MTTQQKTEWVSQQLKQYKIGDPVRIVLGGYTGPYIYGTISRISNSHVTVEAINNEGKFVSSPHVICGLEKISKEVLETAKKKE